MRVLLQRRIQRQRRQRDHQRSQTRLVNHVRPVDRRKLAVCSPCVLWDAFKKHYGPDGDPLILVARGASRDLNPSLSQAKIDREFEKDPASAAAEYGAEFRADIEGFVPIEVVEACTGDYTERSPLSQHKYSAFVDPSGGSSDSFTLAISHKESERIIIDAIRDVRPPFSPEATINDFAILLKQYRVNTVTGDKYAGEFPRELFRRRGIKYIPSDKPKSDLYRDLLPGLNRVTWQATSNDENS
jgi:hypothetical protein